MTSGFKSGDSIEPPADPAKDPGAAEIGKMDGFFDGASPYNSEQAKNFNETAHKLKDLAKNKGFTINEVGFKTYTEVCDKFIGGYENLSFQLRLLTENAPLGDFPYANSVASFNVKIANGQKDSLIDNLNLMYDGYLQAREAIAIARKNYNATEDEHNKRFAKLGHELEDSAQFNDRIDPIP